MLDLGKIVNLTANGTVEDHSSESTTDLSFIPIGLEVTHLPVDTGSASTGFMILAGCMVFFMVPGLALFYSGLSRHTNALSLMMLCMQGMAVVTFQYFLFGFSLSWGQKGRTFVGDFYGGAYNNLYTHSFPNTSPQIPAISFAFFQMMAANIAAALIFGSVPERARFAPAMVFVFFWTTLVYDFTSFWEWAEYGWLRNIGCLSLINSKEVPCFNGVYDWAGGGPIHIASGFSGLVYCWLLGKRKRLHVERHNLVNVFLGTGIMWFGWLAAAAGSAGSSNTRAAMAAMVTAISAAVGGLSWVWFDFYFTRKLGCLGFCSGVIAGLVGISPGAGFVAPWAAVVIGFLSSVLCNLWCRFRRNTHIDDTFETFTVHGCAGVLGMIFAGIFAQKWIGQLDGTPIRGGWVDHHWMQVPYQLVAAAAVAVWSAAVTFILLFIINKIPGLHLRESEEEEEKGGDFSEMGEVAYMLLISEEGNAPVNEGTIETLGERSDGRVISTATAVRTADEPTPFQKETPFLDNLTLGHLSKKFYELNSENEGGKFAITIHKIPHGATVVQPSGATLGAVHNTSTGEMDEVNVTKSNRSKVRMNPMASLFAPNETDDKDSRDNKESNGNAKDGQTDHL